MSAAQKIVDNVQLTAIGRVTMAVLGPICGVIALTAIHIRDDVRDHTKDISDLKTAIETNHNETNKQIDQLSVTFTQKIADLNTNLREYMAGRSVARDMQYNNLHDQIVGIMSWLKNLQDRVDGIKEHDVHK